jgi:hypothetical protein
MAVSRISVHVFDAESRKSLPDLYGRVQFLRVTDLYAGPERVRVEPRSIRRSAGSLELEVEADGPYIGEVRLFDPPPELWPAQEWGLIRPGESTPFWVAVYPDAASWPGNGRARLRDVLLQTAPQLGTYGALKGRFMIPDGAPFWEYLDVRARLERKDGGRSIKLADPHVLPVSMAEPWCAVPVPPGEWTLHVEGEKFGRWSQSFQLPPGGTVDLGDVILMRV